MISRGDESNSMTTKSHLFADEVVVQFNMASARMVNMIGSEIGRTNVVTIEQSGKGNRTAKFMKKKTNPHSFCTCMSQRSIFRLSARASNSRLLFRAPGDKS